jgi:hypothetical protein
MACLECGLEQAVAGGGTCARCGAPLPGAEHPSGTFTGPGGAELRVDGSGIHVRGKGEAGARLISWDEIAWFRDGWYAPESRKPGWMLDIVLADGRRVPVTETWTARVNQAPPELLALVRGAAAAHSVPAVLTGAKVHDGLPDADAGLYYDPAGEPGLREWTGTEWSPFLQVDPEASEHPGQGTGLARIWSPLSPEELHRQSREILRETRDRLRTLALTCGFGLLLLPLTVMTMVTGVDRGAGAFFGALGVALLACWVLLAWGERTNKRIARALSAAATRASAQDDPPAPIEPPDLRTN